MKNGNSEKHDERHPLTAFNHYAHKSLAESTSAWRDLRQQCPVAWTEANGGHWVVTRYEEVTIAFKDWETFSSARTDPDYSSISIDTKIPPLYPEELDPPEWFPLRRILSELLSPAAVKNLASRIEHWVTYYIDRIIETGTCEMSEDLACPIPAAVTLELLGFPQSDWPRISNAFHGAAYEEGTPESARAHQDMFWVAARVGEELAERRRAPRDDAMSDIVSRQIDGKQISMSDAQNLVFLTVGGGVDTTTALTSAAFVHLSAHPADRALLAEDLGRLDTATEEFLRVYPPARTHARIATRDVDLCGSHVAEGDRVLLSEVSACHDDRAFEDADQFMIDRFPNRHVAFGLGIHRCPGSHLARAQFKEIIRQVLERMPDYAVAESAIVEYPNWGVIGGWAKIPAVFTPGHRRL
jgi:cytochrome P450